jgi:DNA modification methylase
MNVLDQKEGADWVAYQGDCVEVVQGLADDSVHFSVYSPPFASLYTYSASERDMGNCRSQDEFAEHYQFLLSEVHRVTKPGRLMSVHCMTMPTSKAKDGVIGLIDLPGQIVRAAQSAGWIFHSRVVIWKDPVTQMQRTKALGLLHKQLLKDSAMSRQGLADEVLTFRKLGDNPERVCRRSEEFPVSLWQKWASPVWDDINPSDTLQYQSAREHDDERHICPLQLEVIERCIRLWTNPGDTVLSPFMGIGSEGHVALKTGRKFVGVELKRSYFDQAARNLAVSGKQTDLFGNLEESA